MTFFEISAEVLVPKFTHAEVRSPAPEWCYDGNFNDLYKKFKVLKLISSNIELGLCWICDAAHVLEFLDIQEFLTNRNNTNNTSDFYQICQSHIRSLFWVFYNIYLVKIQKEFTGTKLGCKLGEIHFLDQFQFRWLNNSAIKIGNVVSNPLMFNHLK